MQPAEMLAQLAADGRALRDAATDLDAPVPPCPGWTVQDAVEHTAMVYAHKSAVLETGARVQVPLFINVGDVVRVDTRSGEYVSRA